MNVVQSKLLDVEAIAKKYVQEKNGKVAYLFARNLTIVSGPLDDLRGVTKETPAMEEFAKARAELGKEFADRDADGAPKQEIDPRSGQMRYSISRLGAFSQAVEKLLVEKYPQAKADQEAIGQKTKDILSEKIDIDFYRMELKKIPGFRNDDDDRNGIIEMGDLAVLMSLGIVYEKEEEESNVTEFDAAKKKSEQKTDKTQAKASEV